MRKLFDCCWSAEPIWKQGVGGVGWYGDHWWPDTASVPESYGENRLPESLDSEIPTLQTPKHASKWISLKQNLTDCLIYMIKSYEMYHIEG